MSDVSWIYPGNSVTVLVNGRAFNIGNNHTNFKKVLEELRGNKDPQVLIDLMDIPAYVSKTTGGKIYVKDGKVFNGSKEIHGVLVSRILKMLEEGFDVNPMLIFLENLLKNTSKTAIDELYLFLEANNLAITSDGHFLAYKRVRKDFKDIFSGKFDNSVGQILEMPRGEVDDRRENTCSAGFHFCSLKYLESFGSKDEPVMILKINPADVVSIPSDYENTKGRTCRYEVVSQYSGYEAGKSAFTKTVIDNWDKEPDVKETVTINTNTTTVTNKKGPVRDSKTGRYVKG